MDTSWPFDYWRQVFEYEFQRVEHVEVHAETDCIDIHITGQKEILKATAQELNESLQKFYGNPLDVVFAFLKKHGILVMYENTLVAFFDIPAYSDFINGTDFKEAVWKINNLTSFVKSSSRTDLDL
jgi:hypothetical protein